MESWPEPSVPSLPGTALPPRLWDTATRELRPTSPGRTARMYVCGITPYDATHLGHAATYVAFDLLLRAWRDAGHEVDYVQNVTDVDDPLLERANATGEDWRELAAREIQRFRDDMAALRVVPPTTYVGAVESMERIASFVEELRAKGATYDLDGDVYFAVSAAPRFGAVAGLGVEEMIELSARRGGDPQRPGKKDPLDCLLWQAARPGEPAWDSPFGPGRPGWHVECCAIALDLLGPAFDVQGGGSDLAFPHHELSAAEGSVGRGAWPFARLYAHAGMVAYQGEKMSKSRGNLVFISRLRDAGVDPMAVRLTLLAHHYRADWEYTDDQLRAATDRLAAWRAAVASQAGPPADDVLAAVRRRMAEDLDAPGALAAVDRWVADVANGRGNDPAAPGLVRDTVDALLGIAL